MPRQRQDRYDRCHHQKSADDAEHDEREDTAEHPADRAGVTR
jgi:hypothetical protein